jgi:type I restriction enzyme M protein
LRDEDVDRIIDTYSQRINIDKYSCVAGLDVVRENDYNLNIPRYVDTYEEEKTINIAAIANELKSLEAEMQSTDETIAEFCKELKIATPF